MMQLPMGNEAGTMKLAAVDIENYRAIEGLHLPLHPQLTVLHGNNAMGKTSVLKAIATGLGVIPNRFGLKGADSLGFLDEDHRDSQPPRVGLTPTGGDTWEVRGDQLSSDKLLDLITGNRYRQLMGDQERLKQVAERILAADRDGEQGKGTAPLELPTLAFYDTDRAVLDLPKRDSKNLNTEDFTRYKALQGSLSARADFQYFFEWFRAKQEEEFGEKNERQDFNYQDKDLQAVRQAIKGMLPGVSNPRIKFHPLCFAVFFQQDDEEPGEELAISQLSGGYRIMLALAADLARRMAQGNPHLADPLQSEAVVLIDEIELHLHPSWQQRVLADLMRTFPNTQFIVSTHSPQVLTTVKPEHIVELGWEKGKIVAGSACAPTYGAESGYVLAAVMGVDKRPPGNEFVKALARYTSLVSAGQGESEEAKELRRRLEDLSPRDHALSRADMEMRRQKLLEGMGKS